MTDTLLSFIIPSYKETEQEIFPLLMSINSQIGINLNQLEIIIIRDGTDFLDLKNFTSILSIPIRQFKLKNNSGPGIARQAGLSKANGKYIMFCDASDLLYTIGIIELMLNNIIEKDLDILKSFWLEEVYDYEEKKITYLEHREENTWLHGKIFKKDFILKHNIHFHPELRIHEDSYFLGLAIAYTEKIEILETHSYIWRFSFDSITRKNKGEYYFTGAKDFIKSCCLVNQILDQQQINDIQYRVCQLIMYLYFYLHEPRWQIEYKDLLFETEQYFVEQIKPFWHYWQTANIPFLTELYNQERFRNSYNWIDEETLYDWITRIGL